jgi:hypothetical protein
MLARLASQKVMGEVAQRLDRGREDWFIALGTSMRPAVGAVQGVSRVRCSPGRPSKATWCSHR